MCCLWLVCFAINIQVEDMYDLINVSIFCRFYWTSIYNKIQGVQRYFLLFTMIFIKTFNNFLIEFHDRFLCRYKLMYFKNQVNINLLRWLAAVTSSLVITSLSLFFATHVSCLYALCVVLLWRVLPGMLTVGP